MGESAGEVVGGPLDGKSIPRSPTGKMYWRWGLPEVLRHKYSWADGKWFYAGVVDVEDMPAGKEETP